MSKAFVPAAPSHPQARPDFSGLAFPWGHLTTEAATHQIRYYGILACARSASFQKSLNVLIHTGQSLGWTPPAMVQGPAVLHFLCHFSVHNSLSPIFLAEKSKKMPFTKPLCRLRQTRDMFVFPSHT